MTDITAIIHTRNAEKHLQEVIDRLKVFDEIIVCDMESTDGTLEIARKNGCRILPFENCGYAEPARDYAMKSAKTGWVFFVDADEIIPEALSRHLIALAAEPGDVRGVRIPRRNMLLGDWSRATYPDYQLRFLHRDSSEWPTHVHSFPKVDGRIEYIPKKRTDLAMIHISPPMADVMERMNRYTTAELGRRAGKRVSLWSLWLKPWVRFFKSYVLKGGFRAGITGYIAARNDANYMLYLLAKVYEEGKSREGRK